MAREYSQGRYKPENPEKYKGDVNKIFYRSSWEKRFMIYCDRRQNILEWNSEEIVVPYYKPTDGHVHRYFVDFWIKYKDKNGQIKQKLIEIKPYKETEVPQLPKSGRKTKRYLQEAENYAVNTEKWKAAKHFAETNGMEFQVLTERELYGKKVK